MQVTTRGRQVFVAKLNNGRHQRKLPMIGNEHLIVILVTQAPVRTLSIRSFHKRGHCRLNFNKMMGSM